MGPVKKKGDAGLSSLEPVPDVIIDLGALGHIGVIQALPRNVAGSFVSIIGTQVGIAEEKEEIFQVLHAAAHQVGEDRFHFRHRHGAGGNQVLVPLLMTWQGYQGYPSDTAIADQLVKQLGHGLFPTQETQDHNSRVFQGRHQFFLGLGGFQGYRVERPDVRIVIGHPA